MKVSSLFGVPPYDVAFAAGADEVSVIRRRFGGFSCVEVTGFVVARLAGSRADALKFVAELYREWRISGWVMPLAYREARVAYVAAYEMAVAEFERQRVASRGLVFSTVNQTASLGNPMTWAFLVEVCHESMLGDSWRRYVEVDRVTGEFWNVDVYAEYRRLNPVA